MDSETKQEQLCCLLCLQKCLPSDEGTHFISEMTNSGNTKNSLQIHLQHLFILRRILKIPVTWCETTLKSRTMEMGDEGLERWFQVCQDCSKSVVKPAWQLHQKILALERKLGVITERVKSSMETEFKRRNGGGYAFRGVEEEVYKMLFPQEVTPVGMGLIHSMLKVEYDVVDERNLQESDSDNIILQDIKLDPSYEPVEKVQKKRGRGRPPGGKPKVIKQSNSDLPRKRGRPPGNKTINFGLIAKRKRGRGRPPLLKNASTKPRKPKGSCWLECSECPIKFLIPETLRVHQEAHKICKEFVCTQCNFPAFTADELAEHVKVRHTSVGHDRPCSECSFVGSVRRLKAHMLEHHPEVKKSQSGILCSYCSKWCSTKGSLSHHLRKQHPESCGDLQSVQCSQCDLFFPSRIRLQYHLKSTHWRVNRLICDICGKGFRYQRDLDDHAGVHVKGKGGYICAVCGLDFRYEKSMQSHAAKYHPPKKEGANPEPQKEFKCKHCNVKSPFQFVIRRHMKTHILETGANKCDICGLCYTSDAGLKRHIQIKHSQQSFKCAYCMKEFPYHDYLKAHQVKYCKMMPEAKPVSSKETFPDSIYSSNADSTLMDEQRNNMSSLPQANVSSVFVPTD